MSSSEGRRVHSNISHWKCTTSKSQRWTEHFYLLGIWNRQDTYWKIFLGKKSKAFSRKFCIGEDIRTQKGEICKTLARLVHATIEFFVRIAHFAIMSSQRNSWVSNLSRFLRTIFLRFSFGAKMSGSQSLWKTISSSVRSLLILFNEHSPW
jgi:hypothetical protein